VAIKESAETWVRGAPGQALILVAAVGIVVGGVAGLGGGYKVEQSRTRSDVRRLQEELKKNPSAGSSSTALGQRIGTVSAVSGSTVTISTKRQGAQHLDIANAALEKGVAGSKNDIVVGRRVLVTVTGSAVIVLPSTSRLGRTVATVGTDSFTIAKTNSARAATITLAKVKSVETVSSATASDVKVGTQALAGGRQGAAKGEFTAVEVILLPPGSGFGS